MQILVINLPESTDRLAFQQKQLKRLGLDYEVVRAVSISYVHERAHYHMALGWERPLLKAEIACYLSHHKTWQMVVKRNEPALILEDDALLSRHVPMLLKELENREDYDLVTLEVRAREKTVARKSRRLLGDYNLLPLYQDWAGAAGYVIRPSGARILLQRSKQSTPGPADAFISNTYALRKFQVEPAAVIQLDQCEHYQVLNRHRVPPAIPEKEENPAYYGWEEKLKFKWRWLMAQLRHTLRQLSVRGHSVTRQIKLHTDDFL